MKKRLLALALCLVMAVSLLPITAAATSITVNSVQIEASGVKKDWVSTYPDVYQLIITNWNCQLDYTEKTDALDILSFITSDKEGLTLITADPVEGETNFVHIGMVLKYDSFTPYYGFANNFSASSSLKLPGYKTMLVGQEVWEDDDNGDVGIVVTFSLTKEHEHDWQFTVSESGNKLTAKCQSCDIAPVSVELKADSVTLPETPFNARLEGWEQFQAAIPTADYEKLVYKYKGSNGWTEVEPTAANAKAGEYQVGVRISGLPNKEYGPVAMSLDDEVIPDGTGYADLYVKYTAVDPKVTAQTGDNRPIEIMMAGVVIFSALAAAAFILDHKRKYQQ